MTLPQQKFQQLQQQQSPSHTQGQIPHLPSSQRHYGCNYIISRYPNGQPRFMLGPHCNNYIFIIALLAMTILFVMLISSMYSHLTPFWLVVMITGGTLFVLSYINIGLSVPGFASRAEQASQEDKLNARYCKPCKIIRTQNVYHCYDCDVCIDGYDHHCPWIGKCVGKNNLCAFYTFLFMTFGTLILCFIATLASRVSKGPNLRNETGKLTVKG